MTRHLMLVPNTSCPARCTYCFGPAGTGAVMTSATVEAVARWMPLYGAGAPLEVTFHGGEPLAAGAAFYRTVLPRLHHAAAGAVRFGLQSNLWLLTDELCDVLAEHGVSLGTSLDGPEHVNDAQRGPGHFRRTMAGIQRARRRGFTPACICTFTAASATRADEIFDFFVSEGLDFSVHAAVAPLERRRARAPWALTATRHGELLVGLLERYLPRLDAVRVSTLDLMCRSVASRCGGVCTFTDCLGDYLAIGPDGGIYPCQRFLELDAFRLGNVRAVPPIEALRSAPAWRRLERRQGSVDATCAGCEHLAICRGGCPYNALTKGDAASTAPDRDPHCAAYRRFFDHITTQALAEVFSPANMAEVVDRPDPSRGLLRQGPLLRLMNGDPHPRAVAGHAARLLVAVAAAALPHDEAAEALARVGVVPAREDGALALDQLRVGLSASAGALNNLYLHATFACPLRCGHCYASAGPGYRERLAPPQVAAACAEAAALGFRHAVVTGGEPLAHPDRDALLALLAQLRRSLHPLRTVLRTSLACTASPGLLDAIGRACDETVVSIDGDQATHDARRGLGTYALTVANLRALLARRPATELSIACVLPLDQGAGRQGASVRALARELGVGRVRMRPLLPLGRAASASLEMVPDAVWGQSDPGEMIAVGLGPAASCGLGQNVYVEPDGSVYPCYAWHGSAWRLGSILDPAGLAGIVEGDAFRALSGYTVDSNRRCRSCALRYLCGGACRAWNRQAEDRQCDLDDPPLDCRGLHDRARQLLTGALGHLRITEERWTAAGLPLPVAPPDGEGGEAQASAGRCAHPGEAPCGEGPEGKRVGTDRSAPLASTDARSVPQPAGVGSASRRRLC